MKKALTIGGVVILVLALIGAGAILWQRSTQTASAEDAAETIVVETGSIEETVSASGNAAPDRQATVAFSSSGSIAEVLVEPGQRVEAGQVLARLDTTSLEWQIARAQASLKTAEARLAQVAKPMSESDIASAQAAVDSAIANYEKVQEGPSEADLASAQAALDSALANYRKVKAGPSADDLAAAQAQVDSARVSVQQAQASYDRVRDRPDIQMRPEAQQLQTATISLRQAEAAYRVQANRPTASELAAAQAQVDQARASLSALQNRPSASDLAAAQAQVAQAEASLASLQDRPNSEDVAVQELSVAETAIVLSQTESQMDDTYITAPLAGTILAVNITEGEWASPGAPAVTIATTQDLILAVNVDEVDVAYLAEGQTAYLSFDALNDETFVGTVTHIAPSSSNIGGAVAYAVEIGFDPGDRPVRLGMTADVDMAVAKAEDALLVPNRAVESDREAGRYYVTRMKAGGTTERLEVRVGLRDESRTQIVQGVSEGDRLVLPTLRAQGEASETFGPPGGGFGRGG
jgi:multidrug efflux pump subunit AcrA (membrane-fusion protein)